MDPHPPKPYFSIVIPSLNEEHYLPELLADLCKQTWGDFEVILVDGMSEDLTAAKAQQFQGRFPAFTILASEKRNVSHQRNLGAHHARADWILFLDADNRLPEDFLQNIKTLTEREHFEVLSTWLQPDSESLKEKAIAILINLAIEFSKNTRSPLLREAFVCVNQEAFLKLGGFDETVPIREGTDLLKRAYACNMRFLFRRSPRFVYSYRRLRQQGALRTFWNSLVIETAGITNHKISSTLSQRLYPMHGGNYFETAANSAGGVKKSMTES